MAPVALWGAEDSSRFSVSAVGRPVCWIQLTESWISERKGGVEGCESTHKGQPSCCRSFTGIPLGATKVRQTLSGTRRGRREMSPTPKRLQTLWIMTQQQFLTQLQSV